MNQQHLFNFSQEEGTEFTPEVFGSKSYSGNESMLPPKVEDLPSDSKPVSDPKCLKEASFNEAPVDNERMIQNQTFQIDAGKEEAKAPKRPPPFEHEEAAFQKSHIDNSRTSDRSTASSEKPEEKHIQDSYYLSLNPNRSPSTQDSLDSDHGGDAIQENQTGVNEKAIGRPQSCYKSAYPAILVYICNFFGSIFFSNGNESPRKESPSDEPIKVVLSRTIANCETKLEEASQKFEERKSELNLVCQGKIQELAHSKLSNKQREMKEKDLNKIRIARIEEARIQSSLQHLFLEKITFSKEEILPILKTDQYKFINHEVQFVVAVRDILKFYDLQQQDFETFKRKHIKSKSLKSMTTWHSGKSGGTQEKKKAEKEKSEKVGVMMTIIVAMALKFIPLEHNLLTYQTREPLTASFLHFLFTSQCEPQNLLLLRKKEARQHISIEIEKLFEDLLEKIKKALHVVGNKKQMESLRHVMLNQVLLSIDEKRGLYWEKEKETNTRLKGRKSSKIS